jgi:predicted transcriptional regulator
MSSPIIAIDSKSSASTAIDLMLKNNVRHLLVIDDETINGNQPTGIITPLDLVKYEEFTRDQEKNDVLEMILEYYV